MIQQAERGQLILVKRWVKQADDGPMAYRARERETAQQRAEGVFQESLGPARRSAATSPRRSPAQPNRRSDERKLP